MRPIRLLLITSCTSWLAGCHSQKPLLIENYAQAQKAAAAYRRHPFRENMGIIGPYADAPIRGRQAKATSEAVLTGQVNLLLENGKMGAQPGALVWAGSKMTTTDEAGRYKLPLAPGRYELHAGTIGLLVSLARPLQVGAGDSICLNFKLLADSRGTYN